MYVDLDPNTVEDLAIAGITALAIVATLLYALVSAGTRD